ncbi:hypothetical protein QYE76_040097 [Lolium multiflorum]|uniref:Retrotransposon gag domain-containing protein n=1 Tax=Lolium multiflorum TaxID=4521 RepID=A0AAD8WSW7_LOLMU|nr:hypothetical protein QYE76_040097 [Lolium multiflorum]
MSVGSDNPASSELTSYYCLNCDTRHGLGSSDTPFICNAQYSSGEDSVDIVVRGVTRGAAPHQVYVANRGDGDRTPRSSRRASFENSASNNNNGDHTIAEEEWAAAKAAVLNNTPLPAGTTVGTLNAYRSILEKNRERLSKEQETLERRLSAADRSSERRRGSQGSASRSTHGAGKHRSRMSRLLEDDAREITSNLTKSFITTDTAGMPRPKTIAGATANLAAYLINQRPEGSMAQAHRGALESLVILGDNLVPRKEKTTLQASGSKHHTRDARDDITQSRIDKARRRRAAREDDSDSSDESRRTTSWGSRLFKLQNPGGDATRKFKPTPTTRQIRWAAEPRSRIDDYLHVILKKGNQIAAMQCLQLYLKNSARAWLRGLPKGSIKSWDDLVEAFVANFQATYKRPVGIEELRHCQQKQKESMRSYIGRFTKLLNAAEDVSVDRAIDAFSDGIRHESYIEELGRKKPKTITKLMEIANSWADGEDNVLSPRKPRQRSDYEDDDQPKHDSGGRRDRNRRRKNRSYDNNNLVAAGYSDRQDDRYDDKRDDRQDGNRNNSGNRGNYKPRQQRTPKLPYAEQINAPVTCTRQQQLPPPPPPPPQHQVQQAQPHQPNEAFPPPRGQMSMIHMTGVSRREMKKLTREINLAESIMANIPENVERKEKIEFEVVNWESQYHAILGRPAYAKFMDVPHYAYLKLKMLGNNGTNITVYGSFSRLDNCDRDFQRIAARFGLRQEITDLPSKTSSRDNKEEERIRGAKKKSADLALEASAAQTSAAQASAAKASAVDDAEDIGGSKTLTIVAQTSGEINDASKNTNTVNKPEDEKNPFNT